MYAWQAGEQRITEAGLEDGPVGSSVGLGHPLYFSCDSAVQQSQFRPFPHCYCPVLPALFPIIYSLAPSFRPQSQKNRVPPSCYASAGTPLGNTEEKIDANL